MNLPKLTTESKTRVEQILARAANDIEFRKQLLAEPATALEGLELSDAERAVFTTLRRVSLEEWGVDVRRYRAFLRDNGNKISPMQ